MLLDLLSRARIYDLAHPLDSATPAAPGHPPFRMALLRRHGELIAEDGRTIANELVSLGTHTGTHIDALCHVAYEGRLFNDLDAVEASSGGKYRRLGVEEIPPLFCRGILLDPATARGVDGYEPGQPVTAEDLEAACRHQGVEVREGDAVLVRTGWSRRYADAQAYLGWDDGVPGPDESAAAWLAERRIRVTGADTIAYEWVPAGRRLARMPVHILLLVKQGIPMMEVMNLEELARDRVYEFVFCIAPLRINGATGSPIRPLALVEQS